MLTALFWNLKARKKEGSEAMMFEIWIAWVLAFLLFIISVWFSERRRGVVTLLVLFLSTITTYIIHTAGCGFAPSVAVSACFAIALASLEKRIYPVLAVVSLAISAAFFASGVSVSAITTGFIIALFSRYIVEWAVRNFERRWPSRFFYSAYTKPEGARNEEKEEGFEYRRKAFHFLGGLLILSMAYFLEKETALALFGLAILFTLFTINSISCFGNSLFKTLIDRLERHGKRPLDGVLWFLAGAILLLLFARSPGFIYGGIFAMAAGDAAAAIVGKRFGSAKWFYNRKKSIAGSLAFAIASLPALLFQNSAVVLSAIIVCAILESLDLSIDDNILAAFVFTVFSYV
jgi:dolichol kinase